MDILEERLLEYVKGGPRGEEIHWASGGYNLKLRMPLINCPTLVLSGNLLPLVPRGGKDKGIIAQWKTRSH